MNKGNYYSSPKQKPPADNPRSLAIVHKVSSEEIKAESNFKRLTPYQIDNIKYRLLQGESVADLAEWLGVAKLAIYTIAWRNRITISDAREWSDLEIIFGRRVQMSGKKPLGLREHDEATKENFSLLINKHESLIQWAINQMMTVVPDRDEIMQTIRIMLYYRYHQYTAAKGTFANWMVLNTKWIIATFLNKYYIDRDRYKPVGNDFDPEDLQHESDYDNTKDKRIEALYTAINALPEKQREIMVLYLAGFNIAGIAAKMNLQQSTVRNNIKFVQQSIFETRDKWFDSEVHVSKDRLSRTRPTHMHKNSFEENKPSQSINPEKFKERIEIITTTTLEISEIAKLFNCSYENIRSFIERYGLIRPTKEKIFKEEKKYKAFRIPDEKVQEVKKILLKFHPTTVSKRTGVSVQMVFKIADHFNIDIKQRHNISNPTRLGKEKREEIAALLRSSTLSNKAIAKMYDVSDMSITNIAKSFNIDRGYIIKKLTDEQVIEIKKLIMTGDIQLKKIAELFGVGESSIHDIKKGKAYKSVFVEGFEEFIMNRKDRKIA